MTTQPEANAAGNTNPAIEDEPDMPNVAQPKTVRVSWKAISAVASFALLLIAVTAISIHWAFFNSEKDDEPSAMTAGERPGVGAMSTATQVPQPAAEWCGDATSVVEFLRPLREQLDAPDVTEGALTGPAR